MPLYTGYQYVLSQWQANAIRVITGDELYYGSYMKWHRRVKTLMIDTG